MRSGRSSKLRVALVCAEAASLLALRRTVRRAPLIDDDGAGQFDMAQSLPLAAPMPLARKTVVPLRRAVR